MGNAVSGLLKHFPKAFGIECSENCFFLSGTDLTKLNGKDFTFFIIDPYLNVFALEEGPFFKEHGVVEGDEWGNFAQTFGGFFHFTFNQISWPAVASVIKTVWPSGRGPKRI